MKTLGVFLLIAVTWASIFAQVRFSVLTDKSVYELGDSIRVSIKAVNEGDSSGTLFLTLCDIDYFVDDYNLDAHRPCPLVIVPYVIPPHDSVSWGTDYLPLFPVTDTLAPGRHAVVGELNGYWISDTFSIDYKQEATVRHTR